jgi:hypothetical protein
MRVQNAFVLPYSFPFLLHVFSTDTALFDIVSIPESLSRIIDNGFLLYTKHLM